MLGNTTALAIHMADVYQHRSDRRYRKEDADDYNNIIMSHDTGASSTSFSLF